MKTFQQYVMEQGEELSPKDANGALMRIARLACDNHHEELLDFFHTLAQKDHRIRQELDAYNKDASNSLSTKHKDRKDHLPASYNSDDDDTVVPSGADNLGGFEPGSGGG
jgi:hypothetical protein